MLCSLAALRNIYFYHNKIRIDFKTAKIATLQRKKSVLVGSIRTAIEHVQVLLFDTSSLIEEQKSLDNEISITGQMMEKYTSGNLILTDADRDTLSDFEKRYEKAEKRMQVLDAQIQDKQKRLGLMQQFTQSVKDSKDVYTHFKAEDLYKTVDCIVVNKDGSFTVKFYSGQEIVVK